MNAIEQDLRGEVALAILAYGWQARRSWNRARPVEAALDARPLR
jgi:hypothetical protein